MPRATQQNNASENLPAQQPQERKVIEREKPYEFDDILNGVGALEIISNQIIWLENRRRSRRSDSSA